MRRPVRRTIFIGALIAALGLAALAVAASATKVSTHATKKGKVLADSRGYSLYMFAKDKQGKGKQKAVSNCYGQCAVVWPPLLVKAHSKLLAAGGVNQKLLGTVKRKDGKVEATYNGWPLYLYQPDSKPGDIHGQNVSQFGAKWYLLRANGSLVKPQAQGGCPPGYVPSSSGCLPGSY